MGRGLRCVSFWFVLRGRVEDFAIGGGGNILVTINRGRKVCNLCTYQLHQSRNRAGNHIDKILDDEHKSHIAQSDLLLACIDA